MDGSGWVATEIYFLLEFLPFQGEMAWNNKS
ncbi:MAG: hypothetical protein OJF47_003276 [Nitrospira sp.]|jgi:hypothetical protein|nr:MAG: hypothetical protein OJF47_003276 [Nitrospira sp.]